jgi:hypothetical protein
MSASSRSRLGVVLQRIADRLDAIDKRETEWVREIHDLQMRVLFVTEDHEGQIEKLSASVRKLEQGRENGAS